MSDVLDRFKRYIAVDTQSDPQSKTFPSTAKQLDLGRMLAGELEQMGAADVVLSDTGYVYAKLPASAGCEDVPAYGFISHMDTSPSASGENVKPVIIHNYDGSDIELENGVKTTTSAFPELLDYKGQDLIVTDGRTLLGADDKAGIAEIMSAAQYLLEHPQLMHGTICIAFTPDEEIGRGTAHFDLDQFGAEAACTVDGGTLGELQYENFNAASAQIEITGVNVHPGSAKGKMVNASRLAMEFDALLPADQRPENTEGYEGFFHRCGIEGDESFCQMSYIIRDHDRQKFEEKKQRVREAADSLKRKYSHTQARVRAEISDSYYNMREKIEPHMELVDMARQAFTDCGVQPLIRPIRGGTDGAQLSFRGLPCPNLSAGGEEFHGIHEFISIRSLEKMTDVLVRLAAAPAEGGR